MPPGRQQAVPVSEDGETRRQVEDLVQKGLRLSESLSATVTKAVWPGGEGILEGTAVAVKVGAWASVCGWCWRHPPRLCCCGLTSNLLPVCGLSVRSIDSVPPSGPCLLGAPHRASFPTATRCSSSSSSRAGADRRRWRCSSTWPASLCYGAGELLLLGCVSRQLFSSLLTFFLGLGFYFCLLQQPPCLLLAHPAAAALHGHSSSLCRCPVWAWAHRLAPPCPALPPAVGPVASPKCSWGSLAHMARGWRTWRVRLDPLITTSCLRLWGPSATCTAAPARGGAGGRAFGMSAAVAARDRGTRCLRAPHVADCGLKQHSLPVTACCAASITKPALACSLHSVWGAG